MVATETTMQGAKLDDSQVVALASELNHLLWTEDPPEPGSDIAKLLREDPGMELLPVNMQCQAHSVVCAGLMLRRGEKVITRGGSALIVFPEQGQYERPHFVMKHWWMSTPAGLCDLSLNLTGCSRHKPIIFGNRNVTDPAWKVSFKDDFKSIVEEAEKSHAANVCGVFYQTDNKIAVTKADLESELVKTFSAAQERGLSLRFLDVVEHCERFLSGGSSLKGLQQQEAWERLARE